MSYGGTMRTVLASSAVAALLAVPSAALAQTSTSSSATARIATTVVNPCTKQYVSISGSTAVTVTEAVDGNGQLTAALTGATKAIGAAFSSAGTKYPMAETDGVTMFSTGPEPIELTFMSKLAATGPTRGDRWRLAVNIKASVDQFGHITAASVVPAGTAGIG
jgi:hypothetical protein